MKSIKVVFIAVLCELLLLQVSSVFAACITLRPNADWMERAAAGDLQRVIYTATGKTLTIGQPGKSDQVIIAAGHSAGFPVDLSKKRLGDQGFVLKTFHQNGKTILVAAGATPQASTYALYTLAEHFDAGFYLGGDAVRPGKRQFLLPDLDVVKKPALQIRGVLPWYNFFNSPTTWNIEDYRLFIDQLVKSKNNFLGFHSYDHEPFCAYRNEDGKMTAGAPLVSTAQSTWGTTPMKTSEFAFGTDRYFTKDYFGADCSIDYKSPEEGIIKAQKLLVEALTYAKARGLKTCLGFEVTGDPTASGSIENLELRLKNLVKTYPMLDYVWIWEPEAMGLNGIESSPTRSDFGAQYRRFEKYFQDIPDVKRRSEAVRMAIYSREAYRILKREAPHIRMIVSAWGGDNHLRFTDFYPGLDKVLPKDVIFSALDNIVVSDKVSEAYAKLPKDREFWPIPWFEYDGDQWCPQPNTKRFYNASRDALAKGAKGLLAIHWRTRDVQESHAYISQFAWNTGLDYEDFYKQYALNVYGDEKAAYLLMELQSLGYRWIGGGGQIECGNFSWPPAPEDGCAKLDSVFKTYGDIKYSENFRHLSFYKGWVTAFDKTALLLSPQGEIRTILSRLSTENRKATPKEKQVLGERLDDAYSSFRYGMGLYSRMVANRGELGVLATINTKAWTDFQRILKQAVEAGAKHPTFVINHISNQEVSSILRSTTAIEGKPFKISAVCHGVRTDAEAAIFYRQPGSDFKAARLEIIKGGRIEGEIPASDIHGQMLEYYLQIISGNSRVSWPWNAPITLHHVSIVPGIDRAADNRKPAIMTQSDKVSLECQTGSLLVNLRWGEDSQVPLEVYRILRRSADGQWMQIGSCRDIWFEDRSVEVGKVYSYRVVDAVSGRIITESDEITVPEPPVPSAPEIRAVEGPGRIRIKWMDSDIETSGYNVYAADNPDGPYTKANDTPIGPLLHRERSYTVLAEPGKKMHFKISSLSLTGKEGAVSQPVSASALSTDSPPVVKQDFTDGNPLFAVEDGIPSIKTSRERYLTLPHSDSYNTEDEITIEFMVKLNSPGVMPVLVSHGFWDNDGFFVQYIGGGIRFFLGGVGTLDAGSLQMGKWTHIAATYDGSEMAIYIDGEKVGSKPAGGTIRPCSRNLYIGRYEYEGNEYAVDGFISDFRLYSYARTPEEIKADCKVGGLK